MGLKNRAELERERDYEVEKCKTKKKRERVTEKYNTLIYYLESAPNEFFIQREIERMERSIVVFLGRFDEWVASNPVEAANKTDRQLKTYYNSKFGIVKYRNQIKNLKMLIN